MPNFNNGTVTSVTLDEYDTLSVSGTARLQVTVGSKPQFETTSVGDLTFGPFGFITYITINATGLGSYSQQPSNNPIPVAMVDVSPAQLAAPTSTQLAITNILYQRNAPPYDIYQSNGTALVPLGGIGTVQSGALAASTTTAPNATAVQNAIAASAGTGVVRVAATNAIPLDTAGNGKSMPLVAGQSTAISTPTTLTIAAGAIEGGVCEVFLAVTSTLTLPTTYAGIPAGKGVVVNGSITSGFNYRLIFGISAGDLVIFCFQQSAIVPAPVFLTQAGPAGTVGTAYSYTYAALNTTSFAVFSGALPAGLSLNTSTGALAGTPTTAATSVFVISATGPGGTTNSTAQSVVIAAAATTSVVDTFNNRTFDATTNAINTVGPRSDGGAWVVRGGGKWDVNFAAAGRASCSDIGQASIDADLGKLDGVITVVGRVNSYPSIRVRYSSDGLNGCSVYFNPSSGTVQIAETGIAAVQAASTIPTGTDATYSVTLSGSTVTAKIGATTIVSATLSGARLTQTWCGWAQGAASGASSDIDSFSAT